MGYKEVKELDKMKRTLLMLLAILVIPGMLMATAQLGVFQQGNEGNLAIRPPVSGMFTCYLYIVENIESVVGIQYMLETPTTIETGVAPDIMLISWAGPANHTIVDIGNPWNGHSVGYDYPVSCYPHGYGIMLEYTFMVVNPCISDGGTRMDFPIAVVGNPNAPPDPVFGSLYGVFTPVMDSFGIDGLTSMVMCPESTTPTQEESWGAIKSMYR